MDVSDAREGSIDRGLVRRRRVGRRPRRRSSRVAIEDFFDFSAPFPVVMFVLKGARSSTGGVANRYSRLGVKPGDVLVAPPGDCNRMRTNLAIELFCCPIGRDRLDGDRGPGVAARPRPARDRGEPQPQRRRPVEPGPAAGGPDPRTGPGLPPVRETLQTQIAIHLLWNYSSLARPGEEPDGSGRRRLRPVIDYIRENLTDDVSLETLAGVAGLSPNYFLGAFRQATGRTPHRYVTEMRVARACELLRDPHRPITDVSLAVGFSSQSHLTEVFRRTMKTTPAAYRREVLGLTRNADDPDSDGRKSPRH